MIPRFKFSLAPQVHLFNDCNDNFTPISGETNAIFTTQTSGSYAVEVSLNNCSEISNCFTINTSTGINDFNEQYDINFFPKTQQLMIL